jgi:hypothetical protein
MRLLTSFIGGFLVVGLISLGMRWLIIRSNPTDIKIRKTAAYAVGGLAFGLYALIWLSLSIGTRSFAVSVETLGILAATALNFMFDLAWAKYPRTKPVMHIK